MFEKDLPRQYEEFQPLVAEIKAGTSDAKFIGEGTESRVWQLQLDDMDYAVKIAKSGRFSFRGRPISPQLVAKGKIESGLKALGISGLEQIESGSVDESVAIFKYVKGTRLTNLTAQDAERITKDQLLSLLTTVELATQAGIMFDGQNPSGANAFYDPDNGFTLIDYDPDWQSTTYQENWAYVVQSIGPLALRQFARLVN